MVIKEEEVNIKTKNDREVIITQITKIIMQEHPGNSSHIISDNNNKSIYLKRCIIASEVYVVDVELVLLALDVEVVDVVLLLYHDADVVETDDRKGQSPIC